MRKTLHRALATFLVLVLVCTLLPASIIVAGAAENTHKFSYDMLTATTDKEKIAEGPLTEEPFFSIVGNVTKRWKAEKGVTSVEVDKACTGAIAFTISNTADVTIKVSSTGSSNTSAVAIYNANDEAIANKEEITHVSGTGGITLSYTLDAGTYRVVSPLDADNNRGVRVYQIVVTEKEAEAKTNTYDFAASSLTAAGDKEATTGNLTADGYFVADGDVQKRTDKNTGEVKSVELGKNGNGCITFKIIGTANVTVVASSTGSSNTSTIALVDAEGNTIANKEDITEVAATNKVTLTYTLEAGTYSILSPESSYNRGVRVYAIHVEETVGGVAERAPWNSVDAPVVTKTEQIDGELVVTVDMSIGYNGADSMDVILNNAEKQELTKKTITAEGEEHTVKFTPASSGRYQIFVIAKRAEETNKASADFAEGSYTLPLATPTVTLVNQGANGALTAIWSETEEATSYEVTIVGEDNIPTVKTTTDRQYTFEGLTIGQTYTISVVAVRNDEKTASSTGYQATATAEAKRGWNFTAYGPSTDSKNNNYSVNEDGSVSVWSEGGKGKIQPASTDGLSFYYTAVPTSENFTLRAAVHVNSWTYSNGQEGFGLLATDRLGTNGNAEDFWTNQYMLGLSKIEYKYDFDAEKVYPSDHANGVKFSMRLGVGAYSKLGLTKDNLAYAGVTTPAGFSYETRAMDFTASELAWEKGNYNIVGNMTNPESVDGTLREMTDFVLEIQKNNTGYFLSYYDAEGNLIHQEKYYGVDDLSKLDSEFVYVGFFASRNANITVSDIKLTTIVPSGDAPAEEKPVTKITPTVTITSAGATQNTDYQLSFETNVAGTANIRINDKVVDLEGLKNIAVKAEEKITVTVPVTANDITTISIVFQPDPDQDLGADTVLSGTGTVGASIEVSHSDRFESRENIYVSPNGYSTGDGSLRKPLDIYTAVSVVRPGQTIILLEGTYKLEQVLKIQRGMDGTAENYIRMIADPNAKTRPVFDCSAIPAGSTAAIVHGGNYWLFYGFDVANSVDGAKGLQISGSNNVFDNIIAYHNGNTGIQISRYSSLDKTIDQWPANNLVRNCTSYGNADNGYEDADGFAAKLTIGEGNVFDGCIAYNNADDGWDLYAKVETGPIGSVTIKNCVAYGNGYLEDGTNAGNGNGFKMGGSSITGKHHLINSIAFNNKAKGIDSNSCPDIIVENCTAYNNGSYNVAFYTNLKQDTAFKGTGIISFKDSACASMSKGENLKPYGSQNEADYLNSTSYYWDGSACKNASGAELTSEIFVSLEFKGIIRNEDGTINMQGFLELTTAAPTDAGARLTGAGEKSEDVTVNNPDPEITEDEKAAQTVIDKINALGRITLESAQAIKDARSAYDALTDAQKELVTNLNILTSAEEKLHQLELDNAEPIPEPTETTPNAAQPDPGSATVVTVVLFVVICVLAAAAVVAGGVLIVLIVLKKKK